MIDIKALKSRFIDLAIRGKLVPQLDEEPAVDQIGDVPEYPPFEIPEKWKWVYLCNSVTFNPKVSCPVDELVSFLGMKDVCSFSLLNNSQTSKIMNTFPEKRRSEKCLT